MLCAKCGAFRTTFSRSITPPYPMKRSETIPASISALLSPTKIIFSPVCFFILSITFPLPPSYASGSSSSRPKYSPCALKTAPTPIHKSSLSDKNLLNSLTTISRLFERMPTFTSFNSDNFSTVSNAFFSRLFL